MKNYIVCWIERRNGELLDRYRSFLEQNNPDSKEEAEDFYKSLLEDEEVITANLSLIILSTDY